eukprot:gene15120-10807_t
MRAPDGVDVLQQLRRIAAQPWYEACPLKATMVAVLLVRLFTCEAIDVDRWMMFLG